MLTGGIPAEYVGAPGLLSSVITKSGSNTFHGSGNYFFQNDDLVGREQELGAARSSRRSTPRSRFGGPVVRDKAWFFGSYRRVEREDDVTSLDTRRVPADGQEQAGSGLREGHVHADAQRHGQLHVPQRSDRHQRPPRSRPDERARSRARAGRRQLQLQLLAPPGSGADRRRPERQAQRRSHRSVGDPRRLEHRHLSLDRRPHARPTSSCGGFGQDIIDQRDTKGVRGSVQYTWNRHTFKGGLEWSAQRQLPRH